MYLLAEVRKEARWQLDQLLRREPAYRGVSIETLELCAEPVPTPQNHDLFAILAGVRNDSCEGVIPIAEGRGLPDDVSADVRAFLAQPRLSYIYGTTWLLLRELVDFPWDRSTALVAGWVPDHRKAAFSDGRSPFPFRDYAEVPIFGNEARDTVRVTWTETYRQLATRSVCGVLDPWDFFAVTIPHLQRLGGPDHVRAILYFGRGERPAAARAAARPSNQEPSTP